MHGNQSDAAASSGGRGRRGILDVSGIPLSVTDTSQREIETQRYITNSMDGVEDQGDGTHHRERSPHRVSHAPMSGLAPASSFGIVEGASQSRPPPGLPRPAGPDSQVKNMVQEAFSHLDATISKTFEKEASELLKRVDALKRNNESRTELSEKLKILKAGKLPDRLKVPPGPPTPVSDTEFTADPYVITFTIEAGKTLMEARHIAYVQYHKLVTEIDSVMLDRYRDHLRDLTKCSGFVDRLGKLVVSHSRPDPSDSLDIDWEGHDYKYGMIDQSKIEAAGRILWQRAIDKAQLSLKSAKEKSEKKDKHMSTAAAALLKETPDEWLDRKIGNKINEVVKTTATKNRKSNSIVHSSLSVDYGKMVTERPQTEEEIMSMIEQKSKRPPPPPPPPPLTKGGRGKGKGKGKR
jgi:hypothetical protein